MPALTPRVTVRAAVASLLLLALVPVLAHGETSRNADTFVDSIGVDTHTSFSDTPYASQFDLVKQRLDELGVRHIREDLVPDRPDQYQRLNELGALGIRSTLIVGDPDDGLDGLDELLNIAATGLGSVEALEGPNEFDLRGGAGWMERVAAYQARLYSVAKSTPALSGLTVVGPTIGWWGSRSLLTDLSGSLDVGAIHPYPNGEPPEDNIAAQLEMVRGMSAEKPVFATETGYHTATATADPHRPVDEAAMATYLPRLFLEYYRRGVARTFSYELLDEFADPGRQRSESNFGLLRHDLSPKPAYLALRNLIAILEDPGPAFAPAALDYEVAGDVRGLRQVLLQKRDGTFYLALWRATSVWDSHARAAIDPGAARVTLRFANVLRAAREYLPNATAEPVRALPPGRSRLSLNVGAQVVVVAVAPTRRPAGRIKLWAPRRVATRSGRVAIAARLPRAARGVQTRIHIQRWKRRGWRNVGKGRANRRGTFRRKIKLRASAPAGALKIRVVAKRVKPSNAIRVRVRSARQRVVDLHSRR